MGELVGTKNERSNTGTVTGKANQQRNPTKGALLLQHRLHLGTLAHEHLLHRHRALAHELRLHRLLGRDEHEAAFRRVATAVGKYYVCKRAPGVAYESMEALGGNGYVEDSPMGRLFRQSPLNAIWSVVVVTTIMSPHHAYHA